MTIPPDPRTDGQEHPGTLILPGEEPVSDPKELVAACLLDWHDSPEPTLTASNVVIVRRIGKKTDLIYDGPIILEEDSAPPRLSADETVAYYSAGPSLGHTLVQHLPLGAVAHGRLTYPPDPDYLKETVLIGDWRKTPEGQWRLAGVLLQRPEDET